MKGGKGDRAEGDQAAEETTGNVESGIDANVEQRRRLWPQLWAHQKKKKLNRKIWYF